MFIQKQFDFRNFHSTKHNLVSITKEIRQALDKDKFAWGVSLDFQKAFNTLSHNLLTAKPIHYRIRGITLDWFPSYLTDRKQQTLINNTLPNETVISYGIPEGSVPRTFTFFYIH